MNLNKISITFITFIILNSNVLADVKVKGYYRQNGTYVQPHYRSNPDGNFYNNWSTLGNSNPYTDEVGTKTNNTNKGTIYTTSNSNLNTPNFNSQLIAPSAPLTSESKIPQPPIILDQNSQKHINTKITSNNPHIDTIDSKSNNYSYQQPQNLKNTDTSKLSHMDIIDLESRTRATQRLKNLGYTSDTSKLSHMDMIDLESKIRATQRLKNLGYTSDTSKLSHMDMIDLESKIRANQRLKNLGYTGDTSKLSHMDMINLESKIRVTRRH